MLTRVTRAHRVTAGTIKMMSPETVPNYYHARSSYLPNLNTFYSLNDSYTVERKKARTRMQSNIKVHIPFICG